MNTKEIIENEIGSFNRGNRISCPFHEDKTPSLSYDPKKNKWHCFSCGRGGDGIDFIRDYKGINYVEACKYLGVPLNAEYEAIESEKDKIKGYIEWQIKTLEIYKGWRLIKLYPFENSEGKILYYKAKFSTTNKKQVRYYSVVEGKVVPKRIVEEVPYNFKRLCKALESKKDIFIVEGEKDVDTLTQMGYTATSFKGVKDFNFYMFEGTNIYFVGDTGEAGEKYKHDIWKKVSQCCNGFNVVSLPNIEELGDNADVTDWFKVGHSIAEFREACKDAWDFRKSTFWKYVKENSTGGYTPLRIWQNLEIMLKRKNVKLKYNVISKEVESCGAIGSTRNELITDIYSLNVLEGLNMSRDEVSNSILKIAEKNKYNPFTEWLEANENEDYDAVQEVFNCLVLGPIENEKYVYYYHLFLKWCINVVRTAHNTLENAYAGQGVLVLQGQQGARKTTFFKVLFSNPKWFKGEKVLDPTNRDSVRENTKYVSVELGELDATMKGDQARLKAFVTTESDEYRSPYMRVEERYPRVTTFCATVNKRDFLKDETGSRRWWVIPIQKCDIEKLEKVDKAKFWGAVYSLWKTGAIPYYLSDEENEELAKSNVDFSVESDISIILNESIDWESDETEVHNVAELCDMLNIRERKALKNELERRGYKYQTHRRTDGGFKKGYKLPKLTTCAYDNYMSRSAKQ